MTGEQVWGIVRTVAAALSGVVVAKGWLDEATYTAILGGVGTVFVAVWSFVAKKQS